VLEETPRPRPSIRVRAAFADPGETRLLLPDLDLWIGTSIGIFVSMEGVEAPFGPERGCDLAEVRFVLPGPDGRAVVVGANALGQQRIVLASGAGCHSYRVTPDLSWVAAAGRAGELLILTEGRLYSLRRPSGIRGRVLVRDGMQLLPVPRIDGTRPAGSPFVMQPLSGHVPAGAQVLAAFEGEILVGTRSLGTARVATGGRAVQWLRRGELVEQASSLSVACTSRDDCYLATGSTRAWRFDGEGFSPSGGGDRRALGVLRAPDGREGQVYVASGDGVGVLEGTRWNYPRALSMPVNDLEIAADGRVWMATHRGVAVYDGVRVGRLDARRGLVEDRIEDIALDQFGRVGLRGAASLGLVTP
jgi:hypothetical protein